MSWPWSELGLDDPVPLPEIKRAYAQRLKTTHPEDNPEGFQRLHSAYKDACRLAKKGHSPSTSTTSPAKAWEIVWEDEPLQDREAPPSALEDGPEPPEDWDYEHLLEGKEKAPPEREQEPEPPEDWDYDRIFHQAQVEEDEADLHRRNALRKQYWVRYWTWPRNSQEQTETDEEVWPRVRSALRRIEWMQVTDAPSDVWKEFFGSDLFLPVMRNPDFLFGLEAFLSAHPELSKEVWGTIRTAYAFLKGKGRMLVGWYGPLLRLLWVNRPKKRRREWTADEVRSVCLLVFTPPLILLLTLLRTGPRISDRAGNEQPQSTAGDIDSRNDLYITYAYEVDSAFEKIGENSYYDKELQAVYSVATELGVDEDAAWSKLTQLLDEHRADGSLEAYEFAHSDEAEKLLPLTAANSEVYQHTILSLYLNEESEESTLHFGIALSESDVLITVEARHADRRDAETVKENITAILRSTALSDADAVTEENYQSLFHLAEEYGYEYVGHGYIMAPYQMFGKGAFEGVYIPYSQDAAYLEGGYAIRSSAHGVEIYHTTARFAKDVQTVVEQAYEELVASGVELLQDGIYETVYAEEYDIAYKQVAYLEPDGKQERIAFLFARFEPVDYYHYTQITYLPEHMDEAYPALVEELSDALNLSLPQF